MDMIFKLLADHVYGILFISLILEFVGLPLPGETMMAISGVMGYQGHANYIGIILAGSLGTVIGMQFSYEVGRRLGTKAVDKYGSYIGLTESRMNNATKFFNKYGNIVIVVAYFIPGIRHILGYFSGVSRVDAKKFHIYSTLGGIFWVTTFVSLGYVLGPSWKHFFKLMHSYGVVLLVVALILLVVYLIYKKLGKKEFFILFKKYLWGIIIVISVMISFVLYLCLGKEKFNPKVIDDILFYIFIIILIFVLIIYLVVSLKNNTSKKLLVVIDYQNDFVTGALKSESAKAIEDRLVSKIETYLSENQDIIFTLDTHYPNYLSTREGKHLPVEHCIVDTEGHKLYGRVAEFEKNAKRIFTKDTFGSIDLAKFISRSDYEEIEFCGVVSNICVLSNIVLAQTYNKRVEIIVDLKATAGLSETIDNSIEEYLTSIHVKVIK